ncbi:hypothetical protein GALMADRAFT_254346 [Galerina marginata CBS 339.88]|uniref:Uncharacterized protein n=1 Tax=Galerina marginata (strain CBS 339.88) TaxID=685588 RepID=A0A067STV6_GALM3|nr:hypothetical protein GALMADRAFT_254346 [Galerina marginata CBS 339.88]
MGAHQKHDVLMVVVCDKWADEARRRVEQCEIASHTVARGKQRPKVKTVHSH